MYPGQVPGGKIQARFDVIHVPNHGEAVMSCAKHPLTFIITRTRKVNVIYMFQLTR